MGSSIKSDQTPEPAFGPLLHSRHCNISLAIGAAGAPKDRPWFWGLEFHEWLRCSGPQYGNADDREAAMVAFKATWSSRKT